jgi:hypothetical protein
MVANPQGAIFVFGGNDVGAAQADFWRWDPLARLWTQLSSTGVPALIEPHLAADGQGDIYEFGGIVGTDSDPITGTTTISSTTSISGTAHVSADGHSFGLYVYNPEAGSWKDLTPQTVRPGQNWPLGREDFGFTYDPGTASLWVFAGEGPGDATLNDLWRYALPTHSWSRVAQRYHAPGDAIIDPREIYNISDDGAGGFYLFGGAYLRDVRDRSVPWKYVNDLWHFTLADATWTLVAGRPNAYDPALPVPRHYYGQTTDASGNFYILGGYASDTSSPPYFANDDYGFYANLTLFANAPAPSVTLTYALSDFWRFNHGNRTWTDLTSSLGDLDDGGFIPYVMVNDPQAGGFCTFGGFHPDMDGLLVASSSLWCIEEPDTGES